MGLPNVAGVFSRYSIIGFFLPAFFTLVGLAQTLNHASLPDVYEQATATGQIAILGGAALLVGLLLLGLSQPILRLYEGYPLQAHGAKWPLRHACTILLGHQARRCAVMRAQSVDAGSSEARRFDAKWRLDRHFPHDHPGLLLPTAFGNATRAAERHSFTRWHLNSIAVWSHVESLLSSQEAQVLADARGEVAFFLNFSLLALMSTPAIIVDRALHDSDLSMLLGLVPLALSSLMYICATGAAIRLGEIVRVSVDLHRRELYTRLGVRNPENFADERTIAWNLNNTLLIGEHLPDDLANTPVQRVEHQGTVEVTPRPGMSPTEEAPNGS